MIMIFINPKWIQELADVSSARSRNASEWSSEVIRPSAGGYGGNYKRGGGKTDPSALSFPNRSALSSVRTGTFPSTKSLAEPPAKGHVLTDIIQVQRNTCWNTFITFNWEFTSKEIFILIQKNVMSKFLISTKSLFVEIAFFFFYIYERPMTNKCYSYTILCILNINIYFVVFEGDNNNKIWFHIW